MKDTSKLRRWILWGGAIIVVISGMIWAFRPQPIVVEMAAVRLGLFEKMIDEDGLVRVRNRYVVTSPGAGTASRIELVVGDAVSPGDLIALIQPLPPALQDARASSELREAYRAAQASRFRAQAEVARSRAAVQQAQSDYDRARELADQGFTARSQADNARLLLSQEQQALRAARFAEQAAIHQSEMARVALAQQGGEVGDDGQLAKIELDSIRVISPVAGHVLRVVRQSEGAVSTGAELIEIGDVSQLEAVIDVLSEDAIGVKPTMTVRLRSGANETHWIGQVRTVEPVAQTKVSTLGVEEQRVNVIVDFPVTQSNAALGDGYRVQSKIVVTAERDALLIPIGAASRDSEGWHVFVVEDGFAVRRSIEIRGRSTISVWVGSGLEVGEQVIVYPSDDVEGGVRVKTDR
ncbi:MAG: efflux RND transporter periplasmic adaptor subunit [Burkholderiaceae bacterium]